MSMGRGGASGRRRREAPKVVIKRTTWLRNVADDLKEFDMDLPWRIIAKHGATLP